MNAVQIRSTHRWAFRRDEWGLVAGLAWTNDRPCYVVVWPIVANDDRPFTDLLPVEDAVASWEFRPYERQADDRA